MNDSTLVRATHNAACYAIARGEDEITRRDLLLGALQAVAKLRVVQFGTVTLDLSSCPTVPARKPAATGPRYSPEAARLFDEASAIAREDGESRVRVAHLLAAFPASESELLRDLSGGEALDDTSWRAGLAAWDRVERERMESERGRSPLLSVEEAATALGVHHQTIRAYIKSGKLPALRIAGERSIRLLASDLYGLLEPVETATG